LHRPTTSSKYIDSGHESEARRHEQSKSRPVATTLASPRSAFRYRSCSGGSSTDDDGWHICPVDGKALIREASTEAVGALRVSVRHQ
jgi:hypothetical protein